MVTITKTASNKYFVSFSCEEEVNFKPRTKREVGTDVGIKDVIVTSDNYRSGAPKYFNKYAYQLKLAQRALKRKTKGSKRYNEQLIKIARIYEKMANCRKYFIHKETTRLIEQYDVIYLEDLNVAGMLKNRKLSKAVADVGMYEIRRQLEYKAHWYGKEVYIIGRFEPTTSKCSSCQTRHKMSLKDRTFICPCCSLIIDRDLNAAVNIKAAGRVVRGAANKLEAVQT
jgi:putative transposase